MFSQFRPEENNLRRFRVSTAREVRTTRGSGWTFRYPEPV